MNLYDNVIDLSFTNAYVGVVESNKIADADVHRKSHSAARAGIEAWYFEHDHGAFWIGQAMQHSEPLTAWLGAAHEIFSCESMMTVALRNTAAIPRCEAMSFRVSSESTLLQELRHEHFGIYLHVSDEFLFLTDRQTGDALLRKFGELKSGQCELRFKHYLNIPKKKKPKRRAARPYDPIESQISEVREAVTSEAEQAIKSLKGRWMAVLHTPPPADITSLETRIDEKKRRIAEAIDEHRGSRKDNEVLLAIDAFAQAMRTIRRKATELRTKLDDYSEASPARMSYETRSTPTMLRALQRYSLDVARQLNLSNDYVFVPVVGSEFRMEQMFPMSDDSLDETTMVIEVPAEIRLRLGALPVIAWHIATLMRNRIKDIADLLAQQKSRRAAMFDSYAPSADLRKPHQIYEDANRHNEEWKRAFHVTATDLLATAVAGPPFVFAMARFAVGTLSELSDERPSEMQPTFRQRLIACLELLNALHIQANFRSKYLPPVETVMPDDVVDAIKAATRRVLPFSLERQLEITRKLGDGCVVDARPTEILMALWRAVATRAAYVHEIAALVSVARGRLEER